MIEASVWTVQISDVPVNMTEVYPTRGPLRCYRMLQMGLDMPFGFLLASLDTKEAALVLLSKPWFRAAAAAAASAAQRARSPSGLRRDHRSADRDLAKLARSCDVPVEIPAETLFSDRAALPLHTATARITHSR